MKRCKGTFFGCHKWGNVRWSQIYDYEECQRCKQRRVTQIRPGYQPIADGWEEEYEKMRKSQWLEYMEKEDG